MSAVQKSSPTAGREVELDAAIEFWSKYTTEDLGYDWSIENWRTRHYYELYQTMCEWFVAGEVELVAVHTAYTNLAKVHKRNYFAKMRSSQVTDRYKRREAHFEEVVQLTEDDNPCGVRSIKCITPQWEPTEEFAEGMFSFFGITAEHYLNYGK